MKEKTKKTMRDDGWGEDVKRERQRRNDEGGEDVKEEEQEGRGECKEGETSGENKKKKLVWQPFESYYSVALFSGSLPRQNYSFVSFRFYFPFSIFFRVRSCCFYFILGVYSFLSTFFSISIYFVSLLNSLYFVKTNNKKKLLNVSRQSRAFA